MKDKDSEMLVPPLSSLSFLFPAGPLIFTKKEINFFLAFFKLLLRTESPNLGLGLCIFLCINVACSIKCFTQSLFLIILEKEYK